MFGIIALVMLNAPAFAEPSIVGTWDLGEQTCASGTPPRNFDARVQGKITGTVFIEADRLISDMKLTVQHEPTFAAAAVKQTNDEIAATRAKPDSSERQKRLIELNNTLTELDRYRNGIRCTVREAAPYTLHGNVLHVGHSLGRTSDCPGDQGADDPAGNSIITLHDNTMTITSPAETTENSICPKGDHPLTLFTRQK